MIYKSTNNPKQYLILTMSPSPNTRSGPTASNKTLAISPLIPPTSPTSPYLTKYDIYNIQTEIKSSNDKHKSYKKSMNNHISEMNNHYLLCLQNLLIKFPRQKINKKNSHSFHLNSQMTKNTWIKQS